MAVYLLNNVVVLILIVMEDTLGDNQTTCNYENVSVLILIVMEDTLGALFSPSKGEYLEMS